MIRQIAVLAAIPAGVLLLLNAPLGIGGDQTYKVSSTLATTATPTPSPTATPSPTPSATPRPDPSDSPPPVVPVPTATPTPTPTPSAGADEDDKDDVDTDTDTDNESSQGAEHESVKPAVQKVSAVKADHQKGHSESGENSKKHG